MSYVVPDRTLPLFVIARLGQTQKEFLHGQKGGCIAGCWGFLVSLFV